MTTNFLLPWELCFDAASIGPGRRQDLVGCEHAEHPTLRLMEAVLAASVSDYYRHLTAPGPETLHAHVLARQWLESTDRAWPFSFENICEALNLEADAIRESLLVRYPGRRPRAGPPQSPLRHVAGRRRKRARRSPRGMPLDRASRAAS
jgi:hypothetical protein